ncbi:hypothetical protein D3C78_1504550 [compost metagenome]
MRVHGGSGLAPPLYFVIMHDQSAVKADSSSESRQAFPISMHRFGYIAERPANANAYPQLQIMLDLQLYHFCRSMERANCLLGGLMTVCQQGYLELIKQNRRKSTARRQHLSHHIIDGKEQ